MFEIIDKIIIFLCCAGLYLIAPVQSLWVVPLILALTLSSLNSYFEKIVFNRVSLVFYCVLCSYYRGFLLFLPLFFYDVVKEKLETIYLVVLIPILINGTHVFKGDLSNTASVSATGSLLTSLLSPTAFMAMLSLIGLAAILKLRTLSTVRLKNELISFQDQASEISQLLEEQNETLLQNQDHEIHVATLSERNRIAREIHDNLGHILSRCLLQIGAMLAVNKDETLKEMLVSVKDNLSQGMDSVRKSVHNLHDESIDLKDEVNQLAKGFSFCPVRLCYDMGESPDKKLKYAFISIIKEAFSNIIKHSNATEVSLILREHPGFYQLVIEDNGTTETCSDAKGHNLAESYSTEKGIGLRNILDRVASFKGHATITAEEGFKIFISIPKEDLK